MKNSKFVKEHMKLVTPNALRQFRSDEETFISFASSVGKFGHVEIGVNVKGRYVVRTKDSSKTFVVADDAVKEYERLITEE